jgi:glycosyltransferase involved in cell wall biosynthesis
MFQASVVIAFYNDLNLLNLILDSLAEEKTYDFEVIIADDGSEQDVVAAVSVMQPRYAFPIVHLWQPDDGFRKPKILNRAVVHARSEVLIFLDGDCVPQRNFLRSHLGARAVPHCRAGRRIDLPYEYLSSLNLRNPGAIFKHNCSTLLTQAIKGRVKRLEKLIVWPYWVLGLKSPRISTLVGCNFSVEREVVLRLNGFDSRANYAWGAEDSDFERRLRLLGVPVVPMLGRATVFHFDKSFHNRIKSSDTGCAMFSQVQQENRVATQFGLNVEK